MLGWVVSVVMCGSVVSIFSSILATTSTIVFTHNGGSLLDMATYTRSQYTSCIFLTNHAPHHHHLVKVLQLLF